MDLPPQFLNIDNLSASYDRDSLIVSDVSFGLDEGQLGCLLGPSGCGKTTVLRTISGFHPIRSGCIELAGKQLCNASTGLAPEQRNVGMVFQDHSLFPHLNIFDNVSFGLSHLGKSEQKQNVDELLNLIGMTDYANQYPHELSGGQNQRVALARAIAPRPKLLLMDEPFSNLDTELRETLGYEIRTLLKERDITAIMVTHDQHDAFALGDQIGVMSQGKLLQWDNSFNLYHTPQNRFVANFIGDGTFVKGRLVKDNVVMTKFGEVRGESVNHPRIDRDVDLLIRPDDVTLETESTIRGIISRKAFKGAQTLYTVVIETGDTLISLMPSHDDYELGESIGVSINADHLVCFEQENA